MKIKIFMIKYLYIGGATIIFDYELVKIERNIEL